MSTPGCILHVTDHGDREGGAEACLRAILQRPAAAGPSDGVLTLSPGAFAEGLRAAGHRPHWPQRIPTNDGGLAFGQLVAAASSRHNPNS